MPDPALPSQCPLYSQTDSRKTPKLFAALALVKIKGLQMLHDS